jgi:Zn-finger nucleic acid-binding protein
MTTNLICPKCGSEMRNYERNQVMVDQCGGCGGLFLDRGELERLYSAESAFYEGPPPTVPRADPPPAVREPRYEDHRHAKPKKSRKRSFLEEFFE